MDGRRARKMLGVPANAGPDEIRRAFRARALVTHPDHGGSPVAFAEVRAAFDTLTTARARADVHVPLLTTHARVDVYDSAPRPRPRRDFADVLRGATARLG